MVEVEVEKLESGAFEGLQTGVLLLTSDHSSDNDREGDRDRGRSMGTAAAAGSGAEGSEDKDGTAQTWAESDDMSVVDVSNGTCEGVENCW